jgi:hypothetical protein
MKWIVLNAGKNARGFSATPLESGFGRSTFDMVTACVRRLWTSSGPRVSYAVLGKACQLRVQVSERFFESYLLRFEDTLGNADQE